MVNVQIVTSLIYIDTALDSPNSGKNVYIKLEMTEGQWVLVI